ncbi:MAG: pilus assembly protein TadA [Candidatus Omnitrophica bacterium CG11_big_fil_rev_8_21_14_0_20_63_9]|nr:MAG: pilus assembly protein TadA [Candidatus Omnitrophica bacterium CG11_big_fil_rev_8_21_14_0_20_63_9]
MSAAPAPAPQPGNSRCIVVFGTKGGVGKTIVAANLAAALAQRTRKPVCLVDMDVMAVGDVAKIFNMPAPKSVVDLQPALKRVTEGMVPSLEGAIVAHSSNVHLLVCLSNPRQFGQLDPKVLPLVFQSLKQRYEYIVIDGGRGFSEPLIASFDVANLILLVTSPDIVTLYQTKWALGMVESLLFPSSMVKAVLNRAESRGSVGTQDVRAAVPCEVIGEIPSDGRIVGTSLNQGTPLVLAFGYTKVADAFFRLADLLISRPDLYVAHHDIPRHQRADNTQQPTGQESGMMSARFFAGEEGAVVDDSVDEVVLMKRRIHDKLVEELDLKKLDLAAMAQGAQLGELKRRTERVVSNLLAREMGGIVSSHEVRARLVKEITDEALGFGPLEELLADGQVTDILVNNKDQIYVERQGKLELTTKKFISNDQVRAVIERIIAPLGRRIDESSPMVDARLPDGSRVNAIIPPLAIKGPTMSIRKFSRVRYTRDDLIKFGSISADMAKFIEACVYARKNLIISGGTGSGKTTFLNIVSAFIPEGERILTIEDAAELKLVQTHWVSLEGRPPSVEGKGQITIRDLFRNALRMRPDRIIIGECRGGETLDMLQAMNTGHDGSITTIHANSPRDVVSRMDSMVLMSNIDLPVRAIREMVASAIDVIIHTARLSDGSRKVTAISELIELRDGTDVVLQDIFMFRQTGVAPDGTVLGDFASTGKIPTFLQELKVKGIEIDPSMFKAAPTNGQIGDVLAHSDREHH